MNNARRISRFRELSSRVMIEHLTIIRAGIWRKTLFIYDFGVKYQRNSLQGMGVYGKTFIKGRQFGIHDYDLQENLMKVMDQAGKVYKNTQLVLAACYKLNIPVIVTEQYPKGLGHTVAEVKGSLGEHVKLEKISFSACSVDALKVLKGYNRNQILVAGARPISVFSRRSGI